MKRLLKISACAISCATVFAVSACTATVSATIVPNWYADTTLTTAISGTREKLTYAVTFEKGSNAAYSVEYAPGTYTVTLENTTYNDESVYKLTSELQISGAYTLGNDKLEFTDSVLSECYFRNANRMLYPLYSKKTVHSASPRENAPASLSEAVKKYEYVMEVSYEPTGKAATSVYTDLKDNSNSKTEKYSLKNNLTVLDNESLLFAVRGMPVSVSATSKAYVLNPYNQTQETVDIKFGGQTADAKYSFKNVDNGDTEAKEYSLNVNTILLSRNTTMAGKTLTAKYAAPVSVSNTYRCVMLRLDSPLAYNLGTLVYTLTEADFTDK